MATTVRNQMALWGGTLVMVLGLILSGWAPFDRTTWLLEVFPVLIVLPLLLVTRHSYPLTTLLYLAITLHAVVLMVGGAYTYARVPLGFELARWLELGRNPYDKIGHLFQGMVPALAVREILVRGAYVRGRKMLAFLSVSVVLAISASYELIEWAAAVALGQGADEFLGTQGDPWDTQSDMFCALVGSLLALLCGSHWQDKQITNINKIK